MLLIGPTSRWPLLSRPDGRHIEHAALPLRWVWMRANKPFREIEEGEKFIHSKVGFAPPTLHGQWSLTGRVAHAAAHVHRTRRRRVRRRRARETATPAPTTRRRTSSRTWCVHLVFSAGLIAHVSERSVAQSLAATRCGFLWGKVEVPRQRSGPFVHSCCGVTMSFCYFVT